MTFAQFGIDDDVRRRRRPGRLPRGAQAEHQGGLRRDDRQSAAQRLRPRRDRRRSRTTPACRSSSTTRWPRRTCAGRSSTAPTSSIHSVTKYLGGHGTTMGGIVVESGQVPLGQRQLPADDRAVARLSRRALLRDVRRLRLHDEGAHGDDAHARTDARRRFARSCCCRASRRCTCACRGIASRRSRSRSISPRIRAVEWVQLSGCCAATGTSARATLPAARRRRHPDVRRQGRRAAGVALHRGGAVPVAPRERRRREDAGHPSGVDDAPPAVRGRAASRPASRRR